MKADQKSITHEEAHRLIQFRTDGALNLAVKARLDLHLNECSDCRAYSNGLETTVSHLRTTLHKQWDTAHLPLQMDAIYAKVFSKNRINTFLTTRTTLVGIAFLLFFFIAWHSIIPRDTSQPFPSGAIPLIPTPTTQYTATNTSLSDCQNVKYKIHEGDTLEELAKHFSVPVQSILLANALTDTSLDSIQELVIPICGTTPTSTTYPPTFTITPIFEPFSTTPG